jgi:hypothetical protein
MALSCLTSYLGQIKRSTASVVLVVAALAPSACGGSSSKGSEGTRVEFIVTGSAPSGVEITYGDDNSNHRTRSFPLDMTRPAEKNVVYWEMAQLEGSGGRITCRVIISQAGHATSGRTGHADRDHDTCTAQSPNDLIGGWN